MADGGVKLKPDPYYNGQRQGPIRFLNLSCDRKLSPVIIEPAPPRRSANGDIYKHGRPKAQPPYCSSTYVLIAATCPRTCRFKNNGCYVQSGFTSITNKKMDEYARKHGLTGDEVIAHEAATIDAAYQRGVPDYRPLRLHVGGDVASANGARMLAGAAERWLLRGGGPVWISTHRWRSIPRSAWGPIRVFASVESIEDVREAKARGYPAWFTIAEFPSDKRFSIDGESFIPCPAETRGTTCVACRICLDRDMLKLGATITFAVHGGGNGVERTKKRLPVIA